MIKSIIQPAHFPPPLSPYPGTVLSCNSRFGKVLPPPLIPLFSLLLSHRYRLFPMRLSRHKRTREPSAFAPAVGVKGSQPQTSTRQNRQRQNSAQPLPPPSRPPNPLKSALVHFLSGGIAAGIVRASLQPLDTCKTRLQATRLTSTHQSIQSILFTGGIAGLYRGVVPGVVGIVPAAAVYMITFQTLKAHLGRRFPKRKNDAVIAVAAGIGDVAASLVRVPCEVLKQRLQVGVYSNITDALQTVARAGSITRLYAGLGAQLARDVPYAAVEFVVYENLKAVALRRQHAPVNQRAHGPPAAKIQQRLQEGKLPRGQSFLVGGLSGAVAAIVSNPMDVVKTRLMTQMKYGSAVRYRGVAHALVNVGREEGVRAFAKGIAPRIASKALQSAFFFAAYECLRRTLSGVLDVETSKKGLH